LWKQTRIDQREVVGLGIGRSGGEFDAALGEESLRRAGLVRVRVTPYFIPGNSFGFEQLVNEPGVGELDDGALKGEPPAH